MTPQRNAISGEYTVIVLKPLKPEVEEIVSEINSDFIRRFTEYLSDELRDLETSSALLILKSLQKDSEIKKPGIKDEDFKRMEKYLEGLGKYEYVADLVRPLVKHHFSKKNGVKLRKKDEYVLVAKCLQLRSWQDLMSDKRVNKVYKRLRDGIERIWRHYYEDQFQ
jgi:tRNA(Met) cytidine acetyltransferase